MGLFFSTSPQHILRAQIDSGNLEEARLKAAVYDKQSFLDTKQIPVSVGQNSQNFWAHSKAVETKKVFSEAQERPAA